MNTFWINKIFHKIKGVNRHYVKIKMELAVSCSTFLKKDFYRFYGDVAVGFVNDDKS